MESEHIVLLSPTGIPIGSAPKLASHHHDTPLHLAFSCYVFNDSGKLLVTQRALSKKVWPGVWTNSFCGHPFPDEKLEDAVIRRAHDELGTRIKCIECVVKDYQYTTPAYENVIENEICPVFFAQIDGLIHPNPDEVEAYRWLSWDEYAMELVDRAQDYSYWAKDVFRLLPPDHPFRVHS